MLDDLHTENISNFMSNEMYFEMRPELSALTIPLMNRT